MNTLSTSITTTTSSYQERLKKIRENIIQNEDLKTLQTKRNTINESLEKEKNKEIINENTINKLISNRYKINLKIQFIDYHNKTKIENINTETTNNNQKTKKENKTNNTSNHTVKKEKSLTKRTVKIEEKKTQEPTYTNKNLEKSIRKIIEDKSPEEGARSLLNAYNNVKEEDKQAAVELIIQLFLAENKIEKDEFNTAPNNLELLVHITTKLPEKTNKKAAELLKNITNNIKEKQSNKTLDAFKKIFKQINQELTEEQNKLRKSLDSKKNSISLKHTSNQKNTTLISVKIEIPSSLKNKSSNKNQQNNTKVSDIEKRLLNILAENSIDEGTDFIRSSCQTIIKPDNTTVSKENIASFCSCTFDFFPKENKISLLIDIIIKLLTTINNSSEDNPLPLLNQVPATFLSFITSKDHFNEETINHNTQEFVKKFAAKAYYNQENPVVSFSPTIFIDELLSESFKDTKLYETFKTKYLLSLENFSQHILYTCNKNKDQITTSAELIINNSKGLNKKHLLIIGNAISSVFEEKDKLLLLSKIIAEILAIQSNNLINNTEIKFDNDIEDILQSINPDYQLVPKLLDNLTKENFIYCCSIIDKSIDINDNRWQKETNGPLVNLYNTLIKKLESHMFEYERTAFNESIENYKNKTTETINEPENIMVVFKLISQITACLNFQISLIDKLSKTKVFASKRNFEIWKKWKNE